MKRVTTFCAIFLFLLFCSTMQSFAGGNTAGKDAATALEIKHVRNYEIWEVVEITAESIILERDETSGEKDRVEIARSRHPSLKVGDKVRYDKTRDRLRQSVLGRDIS